MAIESKLFRLLVAGVLILMAGANVGFAEMVHEKDGHNLEPNLPESTTDLMREIQKRDRSREHISPGEIKVLVDEGFPIEIINKLIELDGLSGDAVKDPLTPLQLVYLRNAGVRYQTIERLLDLEIESLSKAQPTGPDAVASEGGLPEPDSSPVGEHLETDQFGHRFEVYHSGDTTGLSRQVITRSDGKRIIVYRSVGPGEGGPGPDGTRDELNRALYILKEIRVRGRR